MTKTSFMAWYLIFMGIVIWVFEGFKRIVGWHSNYTWYNWVGMIGITVMLCFFGTYFLWKLRQGQLEEWLP